MSNKNKNKNTVASGRHTAPKLAGFACCTQNEAESHFSCRVDCLKQPKLHYTITSCLKSVCKKSFFYINFCLQILHFRVSRGLSKLSLYIFPSFYCCNIIFYR